MIPARYTDRVVLLTALAVVLASVTLSLEWYRIDYSDQVEGEIVTNEVGFYPDYVTNPWGIHYYHEDDAVGDIMTLEKRLIYVWIILGLAFMGACLFDFRWPSLLLCMGMFAVSLGTVIPFVVRIHNAVSGSDWWPYSADTSDVPSAGFFAILAATVMQLMALCVRFWVVYPWLREDLAYKRRTRSLKH